MSAFRAMLLLFCSVQLAAAVSMKKDLSRITAHKTQDLVSLLQQDLRKNNDDYKDNREPNTYVKPNEKAGNGDDKKDANDIEEVRRNFGKEHKALLQKPMSNDKITTEGKQIVSYNSLPMLKDRNTKAYDDIMKPQDKSSQAGISKTLNRPMFQNKNLKTFNKIQYTKTGTKKSAFGRDYHYNKKNTLKTFTQKISSIFKNVIGNEVRQNKKDATKADTNKATASVEARRNIGEFEKVHKLFDKHGLLNAYLKNGTAQGNAPRNRAYEIDSDREGQQEPEFLRSEELDLVPATGEKIAALKRRGRLCYRSVLHPEGPKYDSKGKIYVKAHAEGLRGHRHFGHTKKPKRVLPRCCNCCKKSVLGCE